MIVEVTGKRRLRGRDKVGGRGIQVAFEELELKFFFLIGKKNFIKKSQCVHKICTKRPNSYKIEGEAETEFKEAIKSATQLAVEKPHTLDQSNKELANFSRS